MKVLMVNGSSRENGCTFTALSEVAKALNNNNIETEILNLGTSPYRDCSGCGACRTKTPNRCIFNDDIVNILIEKAENADGFIFGSPVYYAHPSGRLLSVLDRAFYAGGSAFAYKPAAAVVSARRAGTTASVDVINKYFQINNMPVVSSCYWNMVHGNKPEEVYLDKEGIEIMHNLGNNMAWHLKSFAIANENNINHPVLENKTKTNFIR